MSMPVLRHHRKLGAATAALALMLAPTTVPHAIAQEAAVDTFVQAQMQGRGIPGASIAVIRGGEPVLVKGYGLADVEHEVPATADTVYQLASITKQITATAVLMLVDEKRLTLETPLGDVLTTVPDAWRPVTIAQLLNHTSGIPSYTGLNGYEAQMRRDMAPQEIVDLVRDAPMDFAPGSDWRYNNTGYVLLGLVIEKVSGQPWGAFLQARIFGPLGMRTARVNDMTAVVPHRAEGYAWQNGELHRGAYVSPSQPYAAGALLVSVRDLITWEAALRDGHLLAPSSRAQMTAPTTLTSGRVHPYGFGWDVAPYRTRPRHAHSGGIPGFSTYIARFVDDDLTVIVLANEGSGGAGRLANGIAEIYLPALLEAAPRPIDDTAPEQTAFLRQVVERLAQGSGERSWFTPEAEAFFFPDRIKEGQVRLGRFGALQSFDLMQASTSEKGLVRAYRARFALLDVRCTFTLTDAGKIASIGLQVE